MSKRVLKRGWPAMVISVTSSVARNLSFQSVCSNHLGNLQLTNQIRTNIINLVLWVIFESCTSLKLRSTIGVESLMDTSIEHKKTQESFPWRDRLLGGYTTYLLHIYNLYSLYAFFLPCHYPSSNGLNLSKATFHASQGQVQGSC